VVGQKTLDQERQAIQLMQQHVTGHLALGERLPVIKSEQQQVLESRAYTPAQISAITERQTDKNALATEIAHAAGLRAHEILTLRRADERPADARPTRDEKFAVRQGERYTVVGKGGLCREVLIPHELANRLEATRLEQPERVTDRGVYYQSNYAIGGGQRWSNSFSQASNVALGRSTGAHGLRHSYAQERMGELQRDGLSYRDALQVVSQEMGHFRDSITEVYLR
jgi:integrase